MGDVRFQRLNILLPFRNVPAIGQTEGRMPLPASFLFGTNNSSSISGVWVFRGQSLLFKLRKVQGRWGKDLGNALHIPESEGVLESPRESAPVKEQSCSQASGLR